MPSQTPSSFASAAAGSSRANGRNDGGSSDCSEDKREEEARVQEEARQEEANSRENERGRNSRANGTVTLRRTSTTPFAASSTADSAPPTELQPTNSIHEQLTESRYLKHELLDIFRAQENLEASNNDVSRLFASNWDPGHSNGTNARWNDSRDTHGPYVSWDTNGSAHPIGLEELTEEEKAGFTDVNSPLKPPSQGLNRDSNGQSTNGRRTSVGQSSSTFGLSSPASSRPGTRRQQTSDSISGLGSPAGSNRFSRDEPSPFFSRKANDDNTEDKHNSPFGNLMRSNTAGSALGNGPSSPWGATPNSATMGSFGSFALGGSTNPTTPSEKRPNYGSMRGESRFAHVMTKESSEDISNKAGQTSWRSRPRTDTDPFGDDGLAGSAALGGGQDSSPPLNSQRKAPGLDTPVRGASSEFGMSDVPGFPRGQSHQTPQGRHGDNEPLSPADTNPYRSPPDDHDDESYDGESLQSNRLQGLGGIPEHPHNPFGNLSRGFANPGFDGSDRSQNSSVGASRGFPATLTGLPSLSNLGGMGGWPTSANPIGTPDRENRPGFLGTFGNSLLGPTGDPQSPGYGALGGGIFGLGSSSTGRRGLASLFPAAMQAQPQGSNDNSVEGGDLQNGFGTIGRNAFNRETDSPMRNGRNPFEDSFPAPESRSQGPFTSSDNQQGQTATNATSFSSTGQSNPPQPSGESISSAHLPATQQRQMVMPDRMKWVYLDPQGQVQGPWTGLEMHDWYKASFFTADLSVRKLEDTDFEPLGQLIRRIGNSREPFLVPQIGIPHGAPTTQAGTPFTPTAAGPLAPVGAVQPPFAGAFPSFGTTLTAEQQNNLERRKQEEQFLMARQREGLAQQQAHLRQIQMNPGSLQHHSSAHSLQSQPSFGSMTSPIGLPPQPPIPNSSGFFDGARQAPAHGSQDFFREEDLNRLSLQDRQQIFGAAPQGTHAQQINQMFGQPSDTQHDAPRMELRQDDPQGIARIRQFEQLRAQHDLEEANQASANMSTDPIGPPQRLGQFQQFQDPLDVRQQEIIKLEALEAPSLTQQIQKAASAQQSPIPASQPESPWGKVDNHMPMPFPPPQSTTPLPAPTAQRGRSNLPDALNVDLRSRSETPETTAATPSVAPWAKEPVEVSRGPSLKEIQELEAKKAAKAEEKAAAARRAAHEQELKILRSQPAAPAPGLPNTSTWGSGVSPSTPSTTTSPWATTSTLKSQAATAAHKKTLADIQREEELRKQKSAAATAAAQPAQGITGGKRYADLASKSSSSGPAIGSSWATVGPGGRARVPTGPAASTPPAIRTASSASIPLAAPRTIRPTPATRATTSGTAGISTAKEEFNKWAKVTLAKGLNPDIDVDNFLIMISEFPSDIMAESVYQHSVSMDGNRFAAEFDRRKKLADKGVVEPAGSGTSFSTAGEKAGGWSEVAKKGPPKEEPNSGFKTVPAKKKGKK